MNAILKALSDPTRREILRLLRARDMSAGELAERFPLAASTLSGHFNVLRHAGLVVSERLGTRVVYSLNVSALEEAVAGILGLLHVGGDEDPTGDARRGRVASARRETQSNDKRRAVARNRQRKREQRS